jgi:hypothetical protein
VKYGRGPRRCVGGSNCAQTRRSRQRIISISLPWGVAVSAHGSPKLLNPAPSFSMRSMMRKRSRVERARRSSLQTTKVSPASSLVEPRARARAAWRPRHLLGVDAVDTGFLDQRLLRRERLPVCRNAGITNNHHRSPSIRALWPGPAVASNGHRSRRCRPTLGTPPSTCLLESEPE